MVQMDTSGRELDVVIKIPMSEPGPHSRLVNDPTGIKLLSAPKDGFLLLFLEAMCI